MHWGVSQLHPADSLAERVLSLSGGFARVVFGMLSSVVSDIKLRVGISALLEFAVFGRRGVELLVDVQPRVDQSAGRTVRQATACRTLQNMPPSNRHIC